MTEITSPTSNLRHTAIKISIHELLNGTYVQEVEQNPNYLQTVQHQRIYRLNLIAIVIQKENQGTITNILIDDSTGAIVTRFFEEHPSLKNIEVGDVVNIIGKIRTYNQEKYISPEIIKKTSPLWLKLRLQELSVNSKPKNTQNEQTPVTMPAVSQTVFNNNSKNNIITTVTIPSMSTQLSEEIIEDGPLLPYQKITQLIQNLDKGDGARIEEIIEKSPLQNTEELIETMLKNGDVFQNSPGKIKVL